MPAPAPAADDVDDKRKLWGFFVPDKIMTLITVTTMIKAKLDSLIYYSSFELTPQLRSTE